MREKDKSNQRRYKTGWSEEAVIAALKEQEGRCALCKVTLVLYGRGPTSLAADHDHATGVTRGLLCATCNTLEGYHLKLPIDSEEWGRRIKAYRAKYR